MSVSELSNRVTECEQRLQRWEQVSVRLRNLVHNLEGIATHFQSEQPTPQTLKGMGEKAKNSNTTQGTGHASDLQPADFNTVLREVQIVKRYQSECLGRILECERRSEGLDELLANIQHLAGSLDTSPSTIKSLASPKTQSGNSVSSTGAEIDGGQSWQAQIVKLRYELSSTVAVARQHLQRKLSGGPPKDRTADYVEPPQKLSKATPKDRTVDLVEPKAINVAEQVPRTRMVGAPPWSPTPASQENVDEDLRCLNDRVSECERSIKQMDACLKATTNAEQVPRASRVGAPLGSPTPACRENVDEDLRCLHDRLSECEMDVKRAHSALYQMEAIGKSFRQQIFGEVREYMSMHGGPTYKPTTSFSVKRFGSELGI